MKYLSLYCIMIPAAVSLCGRVHSQTALTLLKHCTRMSGESVTTERTDSYRTLQVTIRTLAARFSSILGCSVCVFSYHFSTSYSVSLSPVVLTTSLPLFICSPENTVDSAFIASVRLEERLLLLYGTEQMFLLPLSMY